MSLMEERFLSSGLLLRQVRLYRGLCVYVSKPSLNQWNSGPQFGLWKKKIVAPLQDYTSIGDSSQADKKILGKNTMTNSN